MRDTLLEAKARALDIPEDQLRKIAPVLVALEARFRPLANAIPFETEPSVAFRCPRENAE